MTRRCSLLRSRSLSWTTWQGTTADVETVPDDCRRPRPAARNDHPASNTGGLVELLTDLLNGADSTGLPSPPQRAYGRTSPVLGGGFPAHAGQFRPSSDGAAAVLAADRRPELLVRARRRL